MRLRDQDISFASKDDEEDKEDKETMVSSDPSKYLESNSKLARILEKSELSRAEERKLLTKMMKRRDNDRLERMEETEDKPVMIDHIKDDGVSTINMELCLCLTTPNVDPSSYWTKAVSSRHSEPRKGNNLYLDHLSRAQVAPLTIRRMSDRGAVIRIPHLLHLQDHQQILLWQMPLLLRASVTPLWSPS